MQVTFKTTGESMILEFNEVDDRFIIHAKGSRKSPKLLTQSISKEGEVAEGILALQVVNSQDFWSAADQLVSRLSEQYDFKLKKSLQSEVINTWVYNVVTGFWDV